MSIVGTRPPLISETNLYEPHHKVGILLAVVLYHSCMFFSGNWFDGAQPVYQAPYLYIVARWLNTFHVQTFTMASGFLFYYLCKEKGRYKNFKNDVLKRAKELWYLSFSPTSNLFNYYVAERKDTGSRRYPDCRFPIRSRPGGMGN